MDNEPFPAVPPRSGNVGPLAGAVIVVLLLASGGLYFFYDQQGKEAQRDARINAANISSSTQSEASTTDASVDGF